MTCAVAPTCAAEKQDACTGAAPIAFVVCDGREIPIFARRTIADAARRAVDDGKRLLALLSPLAG